MGARVKRKNACTRTPLENRWLNRVMNERCVGGCDVDVYVTPQLNLMIRRTVTVRAPHGWSSRPGRAKRYFFCVSS